MRQRIELNTQNDVAEFVSVVSTVTNDVMLHGKLEDGTDFLISAKSPLGRLLIESDRDRTYIDWNTISVECSKDIYSLIQKWAIGSQMEV